MTSSAWLYWAAVALAACLSCRSAAARDLLHTAPLHHLQRLHKRSAYYCGSELVDMLSMVCGPAGISGASGKRAQPPLPVDLVSYNSLADWSPDASVRIRSRLHGWMPDRESAGRASNALDAASGGAARWRRSPRRPLRRRRSSGSGSRQLHRRVKREGIVEECCYNPCGLQTLKSYCNDA